MKHANRKIPIGRCPNCGSAVIYSDNGADNEHMRRGYYFGVVNSRGAHWVDPTGTHEKELGDRYMAESQKATANGYSRFADTLRKIAQSYYAESEFNFKDEELLR